MAISTLSIDEIRTKLNQLIPTANQGIIKIGDSEVDAREFTDIEKTMLIDQLTSLIPEGTPSSVQSTVLNNAPLIQGVIRAVKAQTNSQFKGAFAQGKELTLKQLTIDDFNTVWGSTDATSFEYDVTAGNVYDYIGSSTQPEQTTEENAVIVLGFIERSPEVKINEYQINKNGRILPTQSLPVDIVTGYKFLPLAKPLVALPETQYAIKVKALRTGTVIFEPYGFKICMATEVGNLF